MLLSVDVDFEASEMLAESPARKKSVQPMINLSSLDVDASAYVKVDKIPVCALAELAPSCLGITEQTSPPLPSSQPSIVAWPNKGEDSSGQLHVCAHYSLHCSFK